MGTFWILNQTNILQSRNKFAHFVLSNPRSSGRKKGPGRRQGSARMDAGQRKESDLRNPNAGKPM